MGVLLLDGGVTRVAQPAPLTGFAAQVEQVDRAAMAELGGEPVIYQPAIGDPVEVTGIFDDRFVLSQGDAEAGVETVGPAVFLRLEDLPTDPEQDDPVIVIRGLVYRVIERRPDDMGGIVLALRVAG